jgi:hypothetical protein
LTDHAKGQECSFCLDAIATLRALVEAHVKGVEVKLRWGEIIEADPFGVTLDGRYRLMPLEPEP